MRVVLIGGKLQGVEAAYLAKKAGFDVVLVDKNPDVPASGLADEVHTCDVLNKDKEFLKIIGGADLIIPTLEDNSALVTVDKIAKITEIPFAYDASSYAVSQSKNRSNELFAGLDLPVPEKWPGCGLPVICKPSSSSGSRGVIKITNLEDMDDFFLETGGNKYGWLIQEYLEGVSYSLEIAGRKGSFSGIQVTKIEVDDTYDCKRVTAPSGIPSELEKELREMSVKIAGALDLNGIMDVEAIHSENGLKLLEIDARLPSQTPTVVFHSTGTNMVELLADMFCKNMVPEITDDKTERPVILEHVIASSGMMESGGEHMISEAGAVKCLDNFFGADEAVTDFRPGSTKWAASLIIKGNTLDDIWQKRSKIINDLAVTLHLEISENLKKENN
jgi:pyrrolysine biosynthesis protein PylC